MSDQNPSFCVLEASSDSKIVRDEALERARKLSGVKVIFVGQNEEGLYVFIFIDTTNAVAGSEISGSKPFPDRVEFDDLVTFTAVASMNIN